MRREWSWYAAAVRCSGVSREYPSTQGTSKRPAWGSLLLRDLGGGGQTDTQRPDGAVTGEGWLERGAWPTISVQWWRAGVWEGVK